MRLFKLACLMLFSASANAATVTIDFEEFAGQEPLLGLVESKGFSFGYGGFAPPTIVAPDSDNPTTHMAYCPSCSVTLQTTNGSAFSLGSFEFIMPNASGEEIVITGSLLGGGTVQKTVVSDSVTKVISLDSSWDNLVSVEFGDFSSGTYGQHLDNIVVTAVPIPAAAWLFVSALAGLGCLKRKQTT